MLRLVGIGFALGLGAGGVLAKPPEKVPEPLVLIVMDPLAKELACACVKGHGQRDYRKLAARLETALQQRVAIEFSDDLAESVAQVGAGRELIVIGDRSVVAHGAKLAGLKAHPICELTDPDGAFTLTGSFVVRSTDPAKTLKDLGGRKILFGLPEADEKRAAALAALRAAGVEAPAQSERRATYSDAALDVLDSSASPPPVAVVPSYALRLLTGCGSVKAGELKVIGTTDPVPFITAFATDSIAAEKREKILQTLLGIKSDAKLLRAMESRDGFKPLPSKPGELRAGDARDWPDWRGPARDGHVPRLPERLPSQVKLVWKKAAMTGGLAGLSVGDGRLILAERDFADEQDVYRCLKAETGELLWLAMFPARGHLDFGQSPRATPVIREGKAFLLGAFGELRCVNVTNGVVIWKRNLPREFKAQLPTWGMCAPPLVVDDLLIVNPGGAQASLVALDCSTGRTRWSTPGAPAAYAPFICGEFGGHRQIVGYDQRSLGGWDVKTGRRLWQLVPPAAGDFNVPTPIAVDGGVLVATENNGTRLYRFTDSGQIIPKPAAEFAALAPDTATPVVTGGRVFGAHQGLRCLDVQPGLKPLWRSEEKALGDHATLIADDERVLVITLNGELILLDARAAQCSILSRLRLFDDDVTRFDIVITFLALLELMKLGGDLDLVWNHPHCPVHLKKRILRTVIREIIVQQDENPSTILMTV
ncbi:MAG: PQQ-binding-like beta-propeller repeat protein, partial [Verrucomicrobia bacterium]|nr:PQQ-binding-like beta-propeller repeat protein [Verrucomicrobiota bacterium]